MIEGSGLAADAIGLRADTLLGGLGDDVLIGGPGQDILDGGPGSNVLIQQEWAGVNVGKT